MVTVTAEAGVDAGACRALGLPELRPGNAGLLLGSDRDGEQRALLRRLLLDVRRRDPGLAVVVLDLRGRLSPALAELDYDVRTKCGVWFVDWSNGAVNPLDPALFPSRDVAAASVTRTLSATWESWGPRLEDCVRQGSAALHAGNADVGSGRYGVADLARLWRPDGDGRELRGFLRGAAGQDFVRYADWYELWEDDVKRGLADVLAARLSVSAQSSGDDDSARPFAATKHFPYLLGAGGLMCFDLRAGNVGRTGAALAGNGLLAELDLALAASEDCRLLLAVDDVSLLVGADWSRWFAARERGGQAAAICSGMVAADEFSWTLAMAGASSGACVDGVSLLGNAPALPDDGGCFLWAGGATEWTEWREAVGTADGVC